MHTCIVREDKLQTRNIGMNVLGGDFYQPTLEEEWQALVEGLLSGTDEG